MDDEHDDDIPPEVEEGTEIETESFPDTEEEFEEEAENEDFTPVDFDDKSPAKNNTASATSAGSTLRFKSERWR